MFDLGETGMGGLLPPFWGAYFFAVPNNPRIKALPASLPICVIALERALFAGFVVLRAVVFGRAVCVCFGALAGWACLGAFVG